MDEALFRGGQKFENLQIQLSIAANQGKDILKQYSEQSKSALLQAWNSSCPTSLKDHVKELWKIVVNFGKNVKEELLYVDPRQLYYHFTQVFGRKWNKRDVCFLGVGFICGGIVGIIITLSIKKKQKIVRYMQAVQCSSFLGIESAGVVENAIAPSHCASNEVIINVKSASVQIIDAKLCSGYGRTIGRVLRQLYGNKSSNTNGTNGSITLGRDCSGTIVDIGNSVRRFEVGDEVWLAVPFWAQGTLCQTYAARECLVGRKPKNIGFEGAASVPYAGTVALHALKRAQLDRSCAVDKRVLVLGGCTPVGCVLVQLLNNWKATVTATCYKRAVPVARALGASDVIVCPEATVDPKSSSQIQLSQEILNAFVKELELKEFDRVIVTTDCGLSNADLQSLCNFEIISTLTLPGVYDASGILGGFFVGGYIRFKYILEKMLGVILNDFDETHMCYASLDELADMIENGEIQTVVDKVLQPQDIEIALHHIQSQDSIGSTIITFR